MNNSNSSLEPPRQKEMISEPLEKQINYAAHCYTQLTVITHLPPRHSPYFYLSISLYVSLSLSRSLTFSLLTISLDLSSVHTPPQSTLQAPLTTLSFTHSLTLSLSLFLFPSVFVPHLDCVNTRATRSTHTHPPCVPTSQLITITNSLSISLTHSPIATLPLSLSLTAEWPSYTLARRSVQLKLGCYAPPSHNKNNNNKNNHQFSFCTRLCVTSLTIEHFSPTIPMKTERSKSEKQ